MRLDITESEEKFRTLFETMQEGFALHEVVYDDAGKPVDYRYLDINPAFERMTGLSRDMVIWRTVREVLPQIEEQWIETFCRVGITGEPAELESYVKELDRYYRARAYSPERNKFVVLFSDITEQKNATLVLTRREEQMRVLFETSRAGIIMVNLTGRIVIANNRMAEMFGCTMEELIGSRYPDHLHTDQRGTGGDRMRRLITGIIDHIATEQHYIRKDGSDFWGYLSGRRHVDDNGNLISLVGHLTDITELKQKEILLKASENKFRMLFEHSADPSLLLVGRTFVDCNHAAVEILHAGRKDEVLNAHPSGLSPEYQPDGRLSSEKADEMIATAVRDGSHRFEWTHRRVNGELFPVEVSLTLIQEAGQAMLFTVWRDITDRKRVEAAIRESEERYRTLVDNIPLGISLIDLDHRIIMTNKTQADMLGRPAECFKSEHCYEVFEQKPEPCSHCPGKVCMSTGAPSHAYSSGIGADGSRLEVHILAAPLIGDNEEPYGFIEVVEDITERKRAEKERDKLELQLLHAQKLESLGVLAGGIAHDFNNILMAIIGNADLALMRMNPESPAIENLHRIEQAAARAADLAKQMLAYSGKGKFVVENIDLNHLLEEMLHMLEVSISKKALLRFNLHTPLPSVEADATQLRQIVMNLVINASEAIGDKSGVIAISTGCMECDRNYLKDIWLDENLKDGLYVYLEIADSGCGMGKETLSKLFDPFFTTKFTGRGLGMAAVLGIVRGHKGAIKVYSEQEKGTTFKILLPANSKSAGLLNASEHRDNWHGSGTVLVVDDEEIVRGIGAEMLKELGFTPITANDGQEAVEIFKSTPDIGFVILDLTMPHMDGEKCFQELRQLKPDVKVIISSGFNEQEVTQKFLGKGLAGFIQKPYRLSVLIETIKGIA
ncbi:MAG: PAS domain S-box protein [Desulfuromonadaceae bacterium]|nr:PAS domain S-box protein [Desulfuromonadaceae bacterium]